MTLEEFFSTHPIVAVAFSGGADSAYLLYCAKKYAAKVKAYYVSSPFQPEFEKADAKKLAEQLEVEMQIIEADVLKTETISSNPPDRCYHCKKIIFGEILKQAQKDGFSVLLDGTNASDSFDDRPGIKALGELNVLSPLRLCGLEKQQIRALSQKAGLFTWNKPSYACLATRIPTGRTITRELLEKTEKAEEFLKKLGFCDFRIRLVDDSAKIQLKENQFGLFFSKKEEIETELKKHYESVILDPEARNGLD